MHAIVQIHDIINASIHGTIFSVLILRVTLPYLSLFLEYPYFMLNLSLISGI